MGFVSLFRSACVLLVFLFLTLPTTTIVRTGNAADPPRPPPNRGIPGNIAALYKAKHPYTKAVIALADRKGGVYADFGQHDAIAYVATKNKKYLDKAVPKLLALLTVDPLPNANTVRERFAEVAMIYGWLRPDLTDEQNADFEKRLHRWCEYACAVDTPKYTGGMNLGDSDAVTGYYMGLLQCDQIFGWEWTKREDVAKARDAIRAYCEKAAGGEWIESSAYNLGTLQLLLMGAYASGIENFPEVEKLVPEIVEWQLAILTPDGKAAVQWGDEEEPRGLHIHRRVALFAMLSGISGDRRLDLALSRVLNGKPFASYAHLAWRAVYFAKAAAIAPEPTVSYLHVSEGNGHFIYKRDGALFYVHSPKRLNVHHEVAYASDIQLYLDDEWALTRPLGYAGVAITGEAGNSPLFAGLSSMSQRGPTSWEETTTGVSISSGTSGQYYGSNPASGKPYYDPPPAFIEDYHRTITYDFPGTITVTDSFKGDKPTRVDRYRKPNQEAINNSPLWQQVWHCPERPTATKEGFTWKTPGGKTVTLTAPAGCARLVIDEKEKWGTATSNFKQSANELKWQIRFTSDEKECEMRTVFEVK